MRVKKNWKSAIYEHVQKHKALYLFVTVLFMVGVIFGSIIVNVLDPSQKERLWYYLNSFFKVLSQDEIAESKVVFQHKLGDYLKTLGLMWILGLSVIGVPFLLLFIFVKGLVIGFTVGFLVNQLSFKGLWLSFLAVIPQNVILIPVLIIITVSGIHFSTQLVRNRIVYHKGTLFPQLISFSLIITLMVPLMILCTAVEAYLSPHLMKMTLSSLIH